MEKKREKKNATSCSELRKMFENPSGDIFQVSGNRGHSPTAPFATTTSLQISLQQARKMADSGAQHMLADEEEAKQREACRRRRRRSLAAASAVAAVVEVEQLAPPPPVTAPATLADLEAERALHRRRAERFGGEFIDPVSFVLRRVPSFRFAVFLSLSPPHTENNSTLQNLNFETTLHRPRRRAPARRGAPRAPGA